MTIFIFIFMLNLCFYFQIKRNKCGRNFQGRSYPVPKPKSNLERVLPIVCSTREHGLSSFNFQ